MSLSVVILTADERLIGLVGTRKSGLLPKDIIEKDYFRQRFGVPTAKSYPVRRPTDLEDFPSFLVDQCIANEGLIVLYDEGRFARLARDYCEAAFIYPFDGGLAARHSHNYLQKVIAGALRAFSSLSRKFDDHKFQQALLLPLRSFRACEVATLRNLFCNRTSDPQFVPELEAALKGLRERKKPKRQSDWSKEAFFVDDRPAYFSYGHEQHARIETARPPHLHSCEANGNSRFGRRYDPLRHFNVSAVSGGISGDFGSCHGPGSRVSSATHLNVFPNDYF
ncbi:MAG TPA: hypothetical protein VIJ94_04020 [Caulobacteraceae bacterium]